MKSDQPQLAKYKYVNLMLYMQNKYLHWNRVALNVRL